MGWMSIREPGVEKPPIGMALGGAAAGTSSKPREGARPIGAGSESELGRMYGAGSPKVAGGIGLPPNPRLTGHSVLSLPKVTSS